MKINDRKSKFQIGKMWNTFSKLLKSRKRPYPSLSPEEEPPTAKTCRFKKPVSNQQNMCDTEILSTVPTYNNSNYNNVPIKYIDISEADNGSKSDNKPTLNSSSPLPDYTKEEERLKSYKNWTNLFMRPEKLAKAGFYFLNHDDAVRCAFCLVEGHCWEPEDDPMEDHRKWNPNCSFVRQHSTRNEIDHHSTNHHNQDICGNFEIFPNSFPEDTSLEHLKSLDIQWTKKCFNSDFKTYDSRVESFQHWPVSLKQKPEALAKAGFFYLGVGDQTLCYYCGGGLKNWEDDDDPWEQHARWFPTCNYLLSEMGREFVDSVLSKFNNADESTSSSSTSSPSSSSSSSSKNASTSNTQTKELTTQAPTSTQQQKEQQAENNSVAGDSDRLCKICYKNDVRLVFQPCSHALACVECGLDVEKCPICRKPIVGTVRMFLS